MKKPRVKKRGVVEKIVKAPHPNIPEKAQIAVEEADDLYREIRIENTLETENGEKVKLKEDAPVDVVIEADPASTVPKSRNGNAASVGAKPAEDGEDPKPGLRKR